MGNKSNCFLKVVKLKTFAFISFQIPREQMDLSGFGFELTFRLKERKQSLRPNVTSLELCRGLARYVPVR